MSESNLPTTAQSTKLISFRIGESNMEVSEKAQQVLLTKTVNGWSASEVATMGNSSVFVIRDASGVMRLIKKVVSLREKNKEIANLAGTWIITVPGYNRLNQIAGVHIMTPPSISIGGVDHGNPYVVYENDEIRRVIARKIAIGYSPAGSLVAIDTVRHYNFDAYYMQDLHKKTEKPAAAKYGTSIVCEFDPTASIHEDKGHIYAKKDNKVWTFKRTIGLEGIWIDPGHIEIREVNKQHIAHQKFGDVIAQNMCSRNALKAHPLIAAAQVNVINGEALVMVYGYRNEMSKQEVEDLGKKIVLGEQLSGVKVVHDEANESLEEIEHATVTEVDETASESESPAPKQEIPAEVISSDPKDMAKKILAIAKEKDLDLAKISVNVCSKTFDELSEADLTKLLGVVDKIGAPMKGGAK